MARLQGILALLVFSLAPEAWSSNICVDPSQEAADATPIGGDTDTCGNVKQKWMTGLLDCSKDIGSGWTLEKFLPTITETCCGGTASVCGGTSTTTTQSATGGTRRRTGGTTGQNFTTSLFGASNWTCPSSNASCMNRDNYAQCRKLTDSGCNQLSTMESCPVQFGCATRTCCAAVPECSGGLVASTVPCEPAESQSACQTVTMCCDVLWCRPVDDNKATTAITTTQGTTGRMTEQGFTTSVFGTSNWTCPSSHAACMNHDNYAQCRKLTDSGCNQLLLATELCPVQFGCAEIICCLAVPECSGGLVASTVPCKPAESLSACQTVTICCWGVLWCRPADDNKAATAITTTQGTTGGTTDQGFTTSLFGTTGGGGEATTTTTTTTSLANAAITISTTTGTTPINTQMKVSGLLTMTLNGPGSTVVDAAMVEAATKSSMAEHFGVAVEWVSATATESRRLNTHPRRLPGTWTIIYEVAVIPAMVAYIQTKVDASANNPATFLTIMTTQLQTHLKVAGVPATVTDGLAVTDATAAIADSRPATSHSPVATTTLFLGDTAAAYKTAAPMVLMIAIAMLFSCF